MTWSSRARDRAGRCGHRSFDDFSVVAGNMLAGPRVIDATVRARGEARAGPLRELRRPHRTSLERYQPFIACLAGRHDAVGLTDRAEIEARIERFNATHRERTQ